MFFSLGSCCFSTFLQNRNVYVYAIPNVCHSFSMFMVLPLNIFIACDQAPWGFSAPYYVNIAPLLSPYMQTSTTNFLLCSRISAAAEILCELQHFCNNNNNAKAFHPVGIAGCNNLHPLMKRKKIQWWMRDKALVSQYCMSWFTFKTSISEVSWTVHWWKRLVVSDLCFLCFFLCTHYFFVLEIEY